jgi:hypothetical protein
LGITGGSRGEAPGRKGLGQETDDDDDDDLRPFLYFIMQKAVQYMP